MQKTYLMLESVVKGILKFEPSHWRRGIITEVVGKSNPRFLRSEGSVTPRMGLCEVHHILLWNSLIYLNLDQEVGDESSKVINFDYAFDILGTITGGDKTIEYQSCVDKLFNGIPSPRRRFPEEKYEGGHNEALDMLFSFMKKGLFEKLGKHSYKTAREFLEHAVSVYDRRYFDFTPISEDDGDGLETYSIGNELVYVTFQLHSADAVDCMGLSAAKLVVSIVYMGDIKLAVDVDVTKFPQGPGHTPITVSVHLAYELRPSQLLSGRGNNEASMTTSGTEEEASDKIKVSSLKLKQATEGDSGLQVCEAWRLHVGDMLHLYSKEGEHSLRINKIFQDAESLRVELEGGDVIIFHNHIQKVAISRRDLDISDVPENAFLRKAEDLQVGDIVCRDALGHSMSAEIESLIPRTWTVLVILKGHRPEIFHLDSEVWILKPGTKATSSLEEKNIGTQAKLNLVYDPNSETDTCVIGDWTPSWGSLICYFHQKTYFVGLVLGIKDIPGEPDQVSIRVQDGDDIRTCRAKKNTVVSCSNDLKKIEAIRERSIQALADRLATSTLAQL